MTTSQTAIIPEAGPFALYAQLKVKHTPQKVLSALQALPKLVEELNQTQPNAALNISIAFSHQFWSQFDQALPTELKPFAELGEDDITAPATDVDVLLHCHSNRHDLHFYLFRKLMLDITDYVTVVDETNGFRFMDSRDLTDFIDGTENPEGDERQTVAIIPEGEFAGGSYVMVQKFNHNLPAWNKLSVSQQEKVIGRTKPDSIELTDVPANSHVGRVDIKENGKGLKIVRHSLPFGAVAGDHGLLFIAYCNVLHNFEAMLHSMYGKTDGQYDQTLKYTQAVTGAYFFAPSQEMLQKLAVK